MPTLLFKLGVAQSRDDFDVVTKIFPFILIVSAKANLTIIPQRCNAFKFILPQPKDKDELTYPTVAPVN